MLSYIPIVSDFYMKPNNAGKSDSLRNNMQHFSIIYKVWEIVMWKSFERMENQYYPFWIYKESEWQVFKESAK